LSHREDYERLFRAGVACATDVAPRRPTSLTNILRTQWQGRSETIGEYGRHMERLAGSVSPGFESHTHTQRQTDARDFIICPMLCYSIGTDNKIFYEWGSRMNAKVWE